MKINYTKKSGMTPEIQTENSSKNHQGDTQRGGAKKMKFTRSIKRFKCPANPVLIRALKHREACGIQSQRVDTQYPIHKPIYANPSRGKTKKRERLLSSSGKPLKQRYYLRDLDIAFLAIKQLNADKHKGEIVFVTVNFSEKGEHKFKTAKKLTEYLRERKWLMPTMAVLESGKGKGGVITHAHIVTVATDYGVRQLKSILNKYKEQENNAIICKGSYVVKRPYTALIRAEEEQFGGMPTTMGHESSYWLNTWRELGCSDYSTSMPVDGGIADYLSKEISSRRRLGERFSTMNLGKMQGIIRDRLWSDVQAYKNMSTSNLSKPKS